MTPGRHDLRLAPAAASCWLLAALLVQHRSTIALAVAIGAVALAGLTGRHRRLIALTACCLGLVAASCAWRLVAVESSPLATLAEQGRTGAFELDVRRDAVAFDQHGQAQAVVQVRIHRADVAGQHLVDAGDATAFVEGDSRDLVVGRRFTVVARLAAAESTREVGVLDVLRAGPARPGTSWWEAAERMREGVRDAAAPLPDRPRALLPALVDGDDARVDEQMESDFVRSGLTHLMAVSGTNLTIVLGLVLLLARGAGGRRRGLVVAGLVTVIAFVLIARPDPSVVRAAAMGVVGVAAIGFGRHGGVRALSLAVVALVFIDPWISRSAGFCLSVCATAGILLLAPVLSHRMERWLPRPAALALAVPLAAQLACTPAITALSGEVSLVSVLANVLAAPAVAPATVLGLLGGVLAVVWVPLGQVVAQPAGWCASWIVEIAHRTAGLDGASVPWSVPWQLMLGVVPVATLAVIWLTARPMLAAGVALGLLVVLLRPPTPGWPPEDWVMVACDVGQGDSTVVRVGPSSALLVDAGPDPPAIDRCLTRLGIDRVVVAVFTHDHADHTAGWPGARDGREVGQVLVGTSGGPSGGVLTAGQGFTAGPARVDVLWPVDPSPVASEDGSVLNDVSVVLRVQVRGVVLLLTGDIEPDVQDQLVRSGVDLSADVLKMPHHGSARQSRAFFESVGARVATISAGTDNDYGHPAPAALSLLRSQHLRSWRTDLDGDVAVVVRDGRLHVVARG